LAKYDEGARDDPKIITTYAEWGKWDEEIDRFLPQAELICSENMWPYITYLRLGLRSRHRMLLMKLAYGQEISQKEWEFVSSKTHGDILEIRRRLRGDIARLDPAPSSFDPIMRRLRRTSRRTARKFRIAHMDNHHEVGPVSQPPDLTSAEA
jgi:hypothetical protein